MGLRPITHNNQQFNPPHSFIQFNFTNWIGSFPFMNSLEWIVWFAVAEGLFAAVFSLWRSHWRCSAHNPPTKPKTRTALHPSNPPQEQQHFFRGWPLKQLLDCSLGRLAPQIQIKSIHLFSFSKRKEDWLIDLNFAAISLLHQQPPVINQPSTCLISTYVCFLSIDILTVIIYF